MIDDLLCCRELNQLLPAQCSQALQQLFSFGRKTWSSSGILYPKKVTVLCVGLIEFGRWKLSFLGFGCRQACQASVRLISCDMDLA